MSDSAERLHRFLRDAGASDADIETASSEGWLPILAVDRLVMPGLPKYDADALAEAAGTDVESLHRLWRALGFPDAPEGLALFGDRDLEAVKRLTARSLTAKNSGSSWIDTDADALAAGALSAAPDDAQQARVIAAALSRIATFEAEILANAVEQLRDAGLDDAALALAMVDTFDWNDLAWLIDYVHRLQLRAAIWRRLTRPVSNGMIELGVGFADLSGYTELSEELDDRQLAELLDHFDSLVFDTVAELGGRVVKTIGDEIMYVGSATSVATISLALLARAQEIDELPSLRQGLAFGPLLSRDGDYFGPVVNLASRLTDRARVGTVLVASSLRDQLTEHEQFRWRALRPRRIRGIGIVIPYALRDAAQSAPAPDEAAISPG